MSDNENEWDLKKIKEQSRILEEKNHDLRIYVNSLKEKHRKLRDAARERKGKI